jgi:hypothetical protein
MRSWKARSKSAKGSSSSSPVESEMLLENHAAAKHLPIVVTSTLHQAFRIQYLACRTFNVLLSSESLVHCGYAWQ